MVFGIISALFLLAYTLFLGVFLYAFVMLKILLPDALVRRLIDPPIVLIATLWIQGILFWLNRVYRIQWDIDGMQRHSLEQWFLITANHQSWVDIFVLYQAYLKKAPLLKFFIKKELGYVPVVGQAWWALDFPFMRRYSKAFLRKHPEKAGDDLIETQQACRKFSYQPTSVMNFLEGTRFTAEKHASQNSPYRHLLKPKTGGLAFAIQALGDRFSALTNVTIVYPDGIPSFWDMMCGRLQRVIVRIQEEPIPAHFTQGDYQNDRQLRAEMQHWTSTIWQAKDRQIEDILARQSHTSAPSETNKANVVVGQQ
jgi:1-acyl-sn-glycerol-3-phosphate acyltransferase